ncbi:MAG: LacI family DNA-binding transcriptional regulator [Kiritimatiellae bacterium]|jgi:DNA-binding LacI/PurR family transcriptional regulator|nr:LacI family DNA-binding transcriptional regulator [Kiritimatiellia bacterium]
MNEDHSENRITMRELAKAAGVSVGTVSRALRGDNRISKTTRKAINLKAKQLGYVPHPALGAVMRQVRQRGVRHGESVALLYGRDHVPGPHTNHGQFLRGCGDRLRELGYGIERMPIGTGGYGSGELTRVLLARGIRSCVVMPVPHAVQKSELPDPDKFAFVGTRLLAPDAVMHRVSPNHLWAAQMVMKKITAAGHRKIGLLLHEDVDERTGHAVLSGAAGFPIYSGIPVDLKVRRVSEQIEANELVAWVRTEKLTALFVSFPVGGSLREAGLRVPEELSLVHLDAASRHPDNLHYSGNDQNAIQVGSAAADLVSSLMIRNEVGAPHYPKMIYIEGRWRQGETLRPPP